ncbi:MAG: aldo/keto reductase, partial [Thermoplasmata archaeon]
FSPLGRGFLAGGVRNLEGLPVDDFRRGLPRFQRDNLNRNLVLVDRLAALAKEKGCTVAQLALAWLLSRGPEIVPIPGTKHVRYLEENVKAADLKLSRTDVQAMEQAVRPEDVVGERYSPSHTVLVDRGQQ